MSYVILLFNKLSTRIVSLLKKGRACHPPENPQHWEVAKTTNSFGVPANKQTNKHAVLEG